MILRLFAWPDPDSFLLHNRRLYSRSDCVKLPAHFLRMLVRGLSAGTTCFDSLFVVSAWPLTGRWR